MAKRGRKPLSRSWRLQQQNGLSAHGNGQNIQHHHKYEQLKSRRLNPEQIGASVYDESDFISFRNCLLENYIQTTEWLDVLVTQAIPLSRIEKPRIYPEEMQAESLQKELLIQKQELMRLKERLMSFNDISNKGRSHFTMLKEFTGELKNNIYKSKTLQSVQKHYEDNFNHVLRSGTAIVFRNGLNFNKGVAIPQAPDNYWREVYPRLKRRKMQLQSEQLESNICKQQVEEKEDKNLLLETISTSEAVSELQQAYPQQGTQTLDSMFTEISNEPFNSGFEDAFGDLDSAFF